MAVLYNILYGMMYDDKPPELPRFRKCMKVVATTIPNRYYRAAMLARFAKLQSHSEQ
jgi:hypothetical protein